LLNCLIAIYQICKSTASSEFKILKSYNLKSSNLKTFARRRLATFIYFQFMDAWPEFIPEKSETGMTFLVYNRHLNLSFLSLTESDINSNRNPVFFQSAIDNRQSAMLVIESCKLLILSSNLES